MRMLRWKGKIRNEHVRGSVIVAPVRKKITEKRVKWYRHVKRREEGHVLRRMLDAPVLYRKETKSKKENQMERLA